MRYVLSCILLFVLCRSSFAEDLTKAQCEKIGGTYTKAGCLILGDAEKTKFSGKDIYMPAKKNATAKEGIGIKSTVAWQKSLKPNAKHLAV